MPSYSILPTKGVDHPSVQGMHAVYATHLVVTSSHLSDQMSAQV